jgi:hypothetical protein
MAQSNIAYQAQIHPFPSIIYTSTSVAAEQTIALNVFSNSNDSK